MAIFPLRPDEKGNFPSVAAIIGAAIAEVKAGGKPATLANVQAFLREVANFHCTDKEVIEVLVKQGN